MTRTEDALIALGNDPENLALRERYAAGIAAADPARAEFVRLQIEEMRFGPRTPPPVLARAAALLAQHEGAWRSVGCPECRGVRRPRGGTCIGCDGRGDVGGLVALGAAGTDPTWTLPVTWRGGTPHAVSCRLFEAFGGDGAPARWAKQVATVHGTVREFRLVDREPGSEPDGTWSIRVGDRDACEADARRVPQPLFDAAFEARLHTDVRVARTPPKQPTRLLYPTPDAARAALARGAGALVRAARPVPN